ncbi:hypothetical protein I7I48_06390 [Histoplasma ohiense]|nr:hypothetical protein I7I48_06390 [Histoplasma ohiense (nom. inval.)]
MRKQESEKAKKRRIFLRTCPVFRSRMLMKGIAAIEAIAARNERRETVLGYFIEIIIIGEPASGDLGIEKPCVDRGTENQRGQKPTHIWPGSQAPKEGAPAAPCLKVQPRKILE